MEYNFSNVLLILHVKYFTIGYDLKLLLTKVVAGRGRFFRTQCSIYYASTSVVWGHSHYKTMDGVLSVCRLPQPYSRMKGLGS